jgi:hypothetical protein
MKNFAPLLIATFTFSLGAFAQSGDREKSNAQLLADNVSNDGLVVVSYHVEERIAMKYGTRVTNYDVATLGQVNSNDLGPDNVRIVTPKYGKAKVVAKPVEEVKKPVITAEPPAVVEEKKPEVKHKIVAVTPVLALSTSLAAVTAVEPPITSAEIIVPSVIPMAAEVSAPKEVQSVKVNIVDTYERILDKGYESVDMLKKVANNRFYDGNLTAAAKWYTKLFALTKELDAEYYYRYATSLKSVNELDKSKEMMAVFEKMNNLK